MKFIEESWLILMLGIVFAVLLAGAQTSLAPQIEINKAAETQEAIRQVVPHVAKTEVMKLSGYDRPVYRCLGEDGQLTGWAVDALGVGFADKIVLVIGLTPDGAQITGLKVIENIETPGLGNKIAEDAWASQYKGLDTGREITVQKRSPKAGDNEVQAVTGATISSKAVTAIVNRALVRVRPELARQ